jgi:hypothetical protein
VEDQKIEFKQRRDFGQKLNATFEFMKQEFKPLFKGIIYIAGPMIALSSLISTYFQQWSLSLMDFSFEDPEAFFSDDLWSSMAGLLVFSTAAYIFLFAVVNEYVKDYIKAGNSSIDISSLWSTVKNNLGNYAASIIVYAILMFAFFFAIALVFVGIVATDSTSLMIVGAIGMIIITFMSVAVIYMVPIIYNTESEGILSSIGRTVELLRGKWLSTIGLLIIASIIAAIARFIFAIPSYILMALGFMHGIQDPESMDLSFTQSISYGITIFIATVGNFVLTVIPLIALIFQYYNLVERKDASGLMERIDQMGTGSGDDSDETF